MTDPGPLGPLGPVAAGRGVTDVLVNGPGRVWVDAPGGLRRVPVAGLDTEAQVRALAVRLASLAGRRLDEASPWVDARLPDGTRLHAVLPALVRGGTHLSLRVPRVGGDLASLQRDGGLRAATADVLRGLVARRASLLVTGATGSGKTTLLAAMLAEADPAERLVVVEDATELVPAHPHVVSLEARPANVEAAGGVDLGALVRQALRMRPDRLVVGECRGAEVREVLLALGAGHCGAATLHAASPEQVPARVVALAGTAGIDPPTALLQLRTGVDAVVGVARRADGSRVVTGVWGWADDDPLRGHPRLVRRLDDHGAPVGHGPGTRRTGAHAA